MESKANKVLNSPERSKVLEKALRDAAKDALRQHKQAGNPTVVWQNGEAL